jgi:signal transduction histidine kinase
MSLRNILGLLILGAVLLVPITSTILLNLFPPPIVAARQWLPPLPPEHENEDEDVASVDAGIERFRERVRVRIETFDDAPSMMVGSLLPPTSISAGPQWRAAGRAFAAGQAPEEIRAAVQKVRNHALMLNVAALAFIVGLAMLLVGMLLRRPFSALRDAIADIERGVPPPAWAFGGPTEIRAIGTALVRMGNQMRSSLDERELMLAGLSHDLRSPLARIQAMLELRENGGEDITHALRDVREIDHILRQCIDYARDGRDEAVSHSSVDSVIRSAGLEQIADIEMQLDAPVALPLRRRSLSRALRNLVENAHWHGAPPLRISTEQRGDQILIRISDGGLGIAAETWPRLLEPFTRGNTARPSPGGAGLGLTIARRVATLHGASLDAFRDSESGRFTIEMRLPLSPDKDKS